MSRIEYNPSLNDKVAGQLGDLNVEIQIPLSSIKTLFDETPPASYKVFTALVSQSGGDEPLILGNDNLTIGVTYVIDNNEDGTSDFTNVGAPNNEIGTYFVAIGTTPNSWGATNSAELSYNLGAPTVTVLENTIGNIWFAYGSAGNYDVNSSSLFTDNKTTLFIGPLSPAFTEGYSATSGISLEKVNIRTIAAPATYSDDLLSITPIEIRVYN